MTQSIERPTVEPAEPVETSDTAEGVIAEALGVIDSALARMVSRELVSGGEVADLLLDLRTALTAAPR
jgi:hypothetical protein